MAKFVAVILALALVAVAAAYPSAPAADNKETLQAENSIGLGYGLYGGGLGGYGGYGLYGGGLGGLGGGIGLGGLGGGLGLGGLGFGGGLGHGIGLGGGGFGFGR